MSVNFGEILSLTRGCKLWPARAKKIQRNQNKVHLPERKSQSSPLTSRRPQPNSSLPRDAASFITRPSRSRSVDICRSLAYGTTSGAHWCRAAVSIDTKGKRRFCHCAKPKPAIFVSQLFYALYTRARARPRTHAHTRDAGRVKGCMGSMPVRKECELFTRCEVLKGRASLLPPGRCFQLQGTVKVPPNSPLFPISLPLESRQ